MRTITREPSLDVETGAAGVTVITTRVGGPALSMRAVTRGTRSSPTMRSREGFRSSILAS
jgi:hypothetical protein